MLRLASAPRNTLLKLRRFPPCKMAVTRSATGALPKKAAAVGDPPAAEVKKTSTTKRKAAGKVATEATSEVPRASNRKKSKVEASNGAANDVSDTTAAQNTKIVLAPVLSEDDSDAPVLVPAVLTFSFEEAKQHLITIDRRFEEMFYRLKCKPFEHLERLDPFRTLANSIIGQQISWKAARAIYHRFIRLFDPSLPEKPQDYTQPSEFFPTARQVVSTDLAILKSAGLSGRKAEYVYDLASRFADGRLSTEKLLQADDEELYSMLIEVKGIGRWTVDMFALFSLRRPDILPVGDLGVQRGVIRWFLSLHSPSAYPITISPEKLPKNPEEDEAANGNKNADKDESTLPVVGESSGTQSARASTPDASSILPAPATGPTTPAKHKGKSKNSRDTQDDGAVLPTPFTPSINKTLNIAARDVLLQPPPPLPEGLTPAILRSRLNGKNKIKGALLTPKEMEELTASWRPYRSLAVYYMWALAEPPK